MILENHQFQLVKRSHRDPKEPQDTQLSDYLPNKGHFFGNYDQRCLFMPKEGPTNTFKMGGTLGISVGQQAGIPISGSFLALTIPVLLQR